MGRLDRIGRIALVLGLSAIAACSSRAPSAGPSAAPPAAAETESAHEPPQWKPGSRAQAIEEKILRFRVEHREKMIEFMRAWAASRGNVDNPALARMKNHILNWFSMTEPELQQLPAYLKAFTDTGPYRRLISKPGYSYVAGSVFLPCKAAKLIPKYETGFAYLGGWGVGDKGKAVDAGFQRSDAYDNYSSFILAQGFKQISKFPRFDCGQKVQFKFYAASDTELRLWAKGMTTNGKVEEVVASLAHPANYGWPADGGGDNGIVIKRMTTIGQASDGVNLPDGQSWDSNGSYFGHYAGEREPRVLWSDLVLGRVDKRGNPIDVRPWGLDRSNVSARYGMLYYPQDSRVVWFTCTACANESNAIDLHSKDK